MSGVLKSSSNNNTAGTDFTEGKIMPLLLKFFIPFLLSNLLNSIYNTVDTIIIGQYVGSTGTVAVTLGGKMLTLFTNIGIAFAGGGQILISQLIGAKKSNEINKTIGTLFTEMFVLSIVFSTVTLIFSRRILDSLNTPAESYQQALSYLRITSIGLPLIFGYTAVSSVLRGMGDSKNPLLFIAVAALINIIGDIFFIVRLNLGAAGTAYATVIGQGASLAFSIVLLYRKREKFGFDFRFSSFRPDANKAKLMLKLGYPVALRSCFIHITQLILLGYVNLYGLTEAAAYSIGDKIVHLANIFHTSAQQAGGAMAGQNIGAGRHDRVKTIVHDCLIVTVTAAAALTVPSLAVPRAIFGLFTSDTDVIAYAPEFMRISVIIFVLSAIMGPLETVVTGTGNTKLSLFGGLLDGVIFRIGFSFLFAKLLNMGVAGFFLGDALARLGPIIVNGSYYLSGRWEKYRKLV